MSNAEYIFGVLFQYMNAIIWQDGVTIYMANIIYFIHYKQLKMPLVRFNIADQIVDHRSLLNSLEDNLA